MKVTGIQSATIFVPNHHLFGQRDMEKVRTVGSICAIGGFMLLFAANPYRASLLTLATIGAVVITAAVVVLLYDHPPWTWRKARPVVANQPATQADRFGSIMVMWHPRNYGEKYMAWWKGEAKQSRLKEKLAEFLEWPSISELACQLFDHATFTIETWDRLENWLKHCHNENCQAVADIPRCEVVRMLRDAVSKKH